MILLRIDNISENKLKVHILAGKSIQGQLCSREEKPEILRQFKPPTLSSSLPFTQTVENPVHVAFSTDITGWLISGYSSLKSLLS